MYKFLLLFLCSVFFLPVLASDSKQEKIKKASEAVDEVNERLDTIETSSLVDRIKLSFDYRFTANSYIYRDNSSDENKNLSLFNEDGNVSQSWNMRGRIKLNARLNDSFKFTGWISMYKLFLESAPGRHEYKDMNPTYDLARGYVPNDSHIYLERMYVDWFATEWLALTTGRVSTTGGIPSNLRYDDVSLGTFPNVVFDAPFDGAYSTFHLEKLAGLKNSYFRIGYVPRMLLNSLITNNQIVEDKDAGIQHAFLTGLDVEIPNLNGSRAVLASSYIPKMKTGPTKQDMGNGNIVDLTIPDSLGTFWNTNLTLFLTKPQDAPFDFFLSGGMNMIFTPVRTEDNPNNGFVGLPAKNGGTSTPVMSVNGNDLSGEVLKGYLLYTGFRFHSPITVKNEAVKIGAEYTYTTKNHFGFYALDTTNLSKLGFRGHGLESYVLVPLHRKANFRFAYIYQKHLYDWGLMFAPGKGVPAIDETVHNVNVMLNVYF